MRKNLFVFIIATHLFYNCDVIHAEHQKTSDHASTALNPINKEEPSPLMMLEEKRDLLSEAENATARSSKEDVRNSRLREETSVIAEGESSASNQSELKNLQQEMQVLIEETATINVASDLLQRKEEVTKLLKKNHPNLDDDSSSALDLLIREGLLEKYKHDLALELAQNQQAFSRSDLRVDQKIAEDFETKAKTLAIEVLSLDVTTDPSKLLPPYQQAAIAWTRCSMAYAVLVAKAETLEIAADLPRWKTLEEEAGHQEVFWKERILDIKKAISNRDRNQETKEEEETIDMIEPPLILDEVAEEVGRSFRAALGKLPPQKELVRLPQVSLLTPTPEEELRWKAREEADQLDQEAASVSLWVQKRLEELKENKTVEENKNSSTKANKTPLSLSRRLRRQWLRLKWRTEAFIGGYSYNDPYSWQEDNESDSPDWYPSSRHSDAWERNSNNSNHSSFLDTQECRQRPQKTTADPSAIIAEKCAMDYEEEVAYLRAQAVKADETAKAAEKKWIAFVRSVALQQQKVAPSLHPPYRDIDFIAWRDRDRAAVAQKKSLQKKETLLTTTIEDGEVAKEADHYLDSSFPCSPLHNSEELKATELAQKLAVKRETQKTKARKKVIKRFNINLFLQQHHLNEESPEPLFIKESDEHRKAGFYKIELINKKQEDLLYLFNHILKNDTAAEDDSDVLTFRCDLKHLFQGLAEIRAAHQEEEKQLDRQYVFYAHRAQTDALKALYNKIPGAEAAWEARAHQAKETAIKADVEYQEDLRIIAEADQQALDVFKAEKKKLEEIQVALTQQFEIHQQEEKQKQEAMSRAILNEEHHPWNQLSAEERNDHNNSIFAVNEYNNHLLEKSLALAAERLHQSRRYLVELSKGIIPKKQEKAFATLLVEKAEHDLAQLKQEKEEREESQRWGQLLPEEREAEQQWKKIEANVEEAKSMSPKHSAFEETWRTVMSRTHEVEALRKRALEQYDEKLQEIRKMTSSLGASLNNSPWKKKLQTSLEESLFRAKAALAHWKIERLLRKVCYQEILARSTLDQARASHFLQDPQQFNEQWNQTIKAAAITAKAWKEVLDARKELIQLFKEHRLISSLIAAELDSKPDLKDHDLRLNSMSSVASSEFMFGLKMTQPEVGTTLENNKKMAQRWYASWKSEEAWRRALKEDAAARAHWQKAETEKRTTSNKPSSPTSNYEQLQRAISAAITAWQKAEAAQKEDWELLTPEFQAPFVANIKQAQKNQIFWERKQRAPSSCVIN